MTECRHCPRCTMTFKIGDPRKGPIPPETYRCPVCHVTFWSGSAGNRKGKGYATAGIEPRHAARLKPGPYILRGAPE